MRVIINMNSSMSISINIITRVRINLRHIVNSRDITRKNEKYSTNSYRFMFMRTMMLVMMLMRLLMLMTLPLLVWVQMFPLLLWSE